MPPAHDQALKPGSAPVPRSLTVVVPTFRRPESLERCLRALREQTRAPDQIIVVRRRDDEETDEAVARIAGEVPIDLVACEKPGLCAQMDLGVAQASGDVVALTDDDAAPRTDWAARIMSLYSAPDIGAVGGRDVIHDDPTVDNGPTSQPVGIVTRTGRPLGNHHHEGSAVRDVEFLKGVNLSLRRSLWHVDPGLLGDGNQSHWELGTCLRIRRLGWRVLYDPQLLVDHYADARIGEPQRHTRDAYSLERDAYNELYELVRWLPWWQSVAAVTRAMLVGSRATPGAGIGLWLAARGANRHQTLAEVTATTHARWAALKARPRPGRWATSPPQARR
jgi:glycosyltransferase involved in cell wall biosynthesis